MNSEDRPLEIDPQSEFNERLYLTLYPDVAEAIGRGEFASGHDHYIKFGEREGRECYAPIPDGFDEHIYLLLNPDVADAIARGETSNAIEHYLQHGRHENREFTCLIPDDFDERTYVQVYPDVAQAIVRGEIASGRDHYIRFGRLHGYLIHRALPDDFDEDIYLKLNPGLRDAIVQGIIRSGAEHYLNFGQKEGRPIYPGRATSRRMRRRLEKLATADADEYARKYQAPNSSMDAFDHYINLGQRTYNAIQSPGKIASQLGRLDKLPIFEPEIDGSSSSLNSLAGRDVAIAVNSRSNYFMFSIAVDLADALRRAGANPMIIDENYDISSSLPPCIIVAPHEFFLTGNGKDWFRDGIVSQACMLNTEQIQTQWFDQSLPFLLMSRCVIDMYYHSTCTLRDAGVPTIHWVPDPPPRSLTSDVTEFTHPIFSGFHLSDKLKATREPLGWDERSIDISFFAAESAKREMCLARYAESFSQYETFLYMRRFTSGPLSVAHGGDALVQLAAHISGNSKICLNIHRDEFGAFEWFRIVRIAMCAGGLVVTDHCLNVPNFKPGIHFIQEEARLIPEVVDWVLRTDEGRATANRITADAFALLDRRHKTQPSSLVLSDFIARQFFGSAGSESNEAA